MLVPNIPDIETGLKLALSGSYLLTSFFLVLDGVNICTRFSSSRGDKSLGLSNLSF